MAQTEIVGSNGTQNIRIRAFDPLISPAEMARQVPASSGSALTVLESRRTIEAILEGRDQRPLVIVGPCSIHNPEIAYDYAKRLKKLADQVADSLFVVMRVYFEKPRTRLGWKGLIVDPDLDGSDSMAQGLQLAREILSTITGMGLPAGSETLDPIVPQYISDLLSWASIGARTTESQTHREMASGLSLPVGFKNGTDGSIETAANAMASAKGSHSFLGIDADGRTAIVRTAGNPYGHVILRGGKKGPNYGPESVADACAILKGLGLPERIVVDCSHGNSNKKPDNQPLVLDAVVDQILKYRSKGLVSPIKGVMVEGNIHGGNQALVEPAKLQYGVSITDPCLAWDQTEQALGAMAARLK